MVRIVEVFKESIAAELGIEAGDSLKTINGEPVRDLIDVHLFEQREQVVLEVQRRDGETWELEVEKDAEEPFGFDVEHPEPRHCGNQCVFCFVHQLPRGLRRSLYVKDEDYRFSYLYGAYITLTNLGEDEFERIARQHLSPLYISVHASDDEVRNRLLGKEVSPILPQLRRLVNAGIELHTQVVVCPGLNDRSCLEKTIVDLQALSPLVRSLAVVPVGLTGHRDKLYPLRTLTSDEANDVLEMIRRLQRQFLAVRGSRFVFAADELYLQAEAFFPPLSEYEDLAQIENGVGLIPVFRDQALKALEVAEPLVLGKVSLVTGESFAPELRAFAAKLSACTGVALDVYSVDNRFFGGAVTVTGLIAGADVVRRLKGVELGAALLLPDVMFREGEDVMLDDTTLAQLEEELSVPVYKVESSPWGILDTLEELSYLKGEVDGAPAGGDDD